MIKVDKDNFTTLLISELILVMKELYNRGDTKWVVKNYPKHLDSWVYLYDILNKSIKRFVKLISDDTTVVDLKFTKAQYLYKFTFSGKDLELLNPRAATWYEDAAPKILLFNKYTNSYDSRYYIRANQALAGPFNFQHLLKIPGVNIPPYPYQEPYSSMYKSCLKGETSKKFLLNATVSSYAPFRSRATTQGPQTLNKIALPSTGNYTILDLLLFIEAVQKDIIQYITSFNSHLDKVIEANKEYLEKYNKKEFKDTGDLADFIIEQFPMRKVEFDTDIGLEELNELFGG